MISISKYKNKLSQVFRKMPTWGKSGKRHFMIISTANLVARGQIFPFYFYQKELLNQCDATFTEVTVEDYIESNCVASQRTDIVFFQPWFTISENTLRSTLLKIRKEFPSAKIVFLDCFAPLDLRFAEIVDSLIDLYVKKQAFRDKCEYEKSTRGDTNLVDYYGQLYGIHYDQKTVTIPSGFFKKFMIGPGFVTSKRMLPTLASKAQIIPGVRTIDVHARLGGKGLDWYGKMREHAIESVAGIRGIHVLTGANVSNKKYLTELENSKICFSPFGFGEVCWRDYESAMCGALLLKPDMGHIETFPDIFRPDFSYVPIKWDFSDLEEKIRYYLKNEAEREAIVKNAYSISRDYVNGGGFIKHINEVIKFLELSESKATD